MNYPIVILKKGKEKPILGGHPWVFSNAIESEPHENVTPGMLVHLQSGDGCCLGTGIYNPLTSIRVRLLARTKEIIDADFFTQRFQELGHHKTLLLPSETTAFRLVHGDADDMPGLIVDCYEDVIVFQIHTAGMDLLRDMIVQGLRDAFDMRALVERSDVLARKREGLTDRPSGIRFGEITTEVSFKEQGLNFTADVLSGQKTGFFLDQRDARQYVRELSQNKQILNLFCYTGAFSVYAAAGGATSMTSVDDSADAIEMAKAHFKQNNFTGDYTFLKEDAFDFCSRMQEEEKSFDLIICDPPAFAKSREKIKTALQAYTHINAACLRLLKRGGILVTSSCSGIVTFDDFKNALRLAGTQTHRDLKIMRTFGQAFDHTDKLSFSEGQYLKTLVLTL
jgi:23S rRNA (cytosine1962-C5)-methyltransferase